MILWISAEAVDMQCNQRAEVLNVMACSGTLRVKLCGTGVTIMVSASDVCGVELGTLHNDIDIMFNITEIMRSF